MSATNRGAVRRASDFYATPITAFMPLVPYLSKERDIWEPCCGDWRLVKHLKSHGFNADGNDIQFGYDFLNDCRFVHLGTTVVTNPPYSLAFEFAKHSVAHYGETFLLLRLNFLASRKRKEWFQRHEPHALFILSQRPCFTDDGKTDATDYAWFYWANEEYRVFPRHHGIYHL